MIITSSNELHDHLYEFVEAKMCFRKLKSLILLHKYIWEKNRVVSGKSPQSDLTPWTLTLMYFYDLDNFVTVFRQLQSLFEMIRVAQS